MAVGDCVWNVESAKMKSYCGELNNVKMCSKDQNTRGSCVLQEGDLHLEDRVECEEFRESGFLFWITYSLLRASKFTCNIGEIKESDRRDFL